MVTWQGPSVTDAEEKSRVVSDTRTPQKGRTLNEARALIELSFGNFMGSKVVVSAQQHLIRLHKEIEKLKDESAPEALLNSLNKQSTKSEIREFVSLSKRVLVGSLACELCVWSFQYESNFAWKVILVFNVW